MQKKDLMYICCVESEMPPVSSSLLLFFWLNRPVFWGGIWRLFFTAIKKKKRKNSLTESCLSLTWSLDVINLRV